MLNGVLNLSFLLRVDARVPFRLSAFFNSIGARLAGFLDLFVAQRGVFSAREEEAQKDRNGGKSEKTRVTEDPYGLGCGLSLVVGGHNKRRRGEIDGGRTIGVYELDDKQ